MDEIDLSRFLSIAGEEEADASELATFFVTYLSEQLTALHTALAGGQAKDVELIAHRLTGSCGTYGMDAIARPLAGMERFAREQQLASAEALEREVRVAFDATARALAPFLKGDSTAEKETP